MKQKFKHTYMQTAKLWANMSSAVKLKVGAVIVSEEAIVVGYNGTPEGWDNVCEKREWMPQGCLHLDHEYPFVEYSDYDDTAIIGRYRLTTKSEVLHAEMNAISKLAKSTLSGKGAVLFCTHSPCLSCAKAVYQAGIREVYYANNYRSDEGVLFLKKCGVKVELLEEE